MTGIDSAPPLRVCTMQKHRGSCSPAGVITLNLIQARKVLIDYVIIHELCDLQEHNHSDEYLRHLCRYIHANPVRHGLAAAPELWPYSNYLEWIKQRPGKLVDHALVAQHFPSPEQYKAYVYSYLTGQATLLEGLRNYLENL